MVQLRRCLVIPQKQKQTKKQNRKTTNVYSDIDPSVLLPYYTFLLLRYYTAELSRKSEVSATTEIS